MSIEQKREIIFCQNDHKITQERLRFYFNDKFNLTISKTSISDLLKPENQKKILDASENSSNEIRIRQA